MGLASESSAQSSQAALSSPAPDTALAGPSVTFSWTAVAGSTDYALWLGTTKGARDLYVSGPITASSATASNLPSGGQTIYARLFTIFGSTRLYTDYTYTAATQAALTSPSPGSTLAGPPITFSWSATPGSTDYALWLGTTRGTYDLYVSGPVTSTSATVSRLSTNGQIIYARLFTIFGSTRRYTDYTYTAVPALSLQSTSIPFGVVTVGNSSYQSVRLTSSGTAAVTINAGSVSGAGYTISGMSFPATLNAGATATLEIEFDPTATGVANGAVTLTSNSSTGTTATVSLTGTGEAASYEVNLTWDAPTDSSDPVAGYDIYRAVTGGSTYQLLNSSVNTTNTYSDTTAASGTSYTYYVVSVDAEGNRSVPSNSFTVSVP